MTPDTSRHLAHAAEIRALTSQSMPPDAWKTDPKYLTWSVCSTTLPSMQTEVGSVVLQATYSVFATFSCKPPFSSDSFHMLTRCTNRPLSASASAMSSAYMSSHGGCSCASRMLSDSESSITLNRNGLRTEPWCTPTVTGKGLVSPTAVRTTESESRYMSRIMSI
uniref:Uncharacterized protein n=1 Tax=Heliothis virescens TaxID=7102 RepID=A0A2A4JYJ4_HELVI